MTNEERLTAIESRLSALESRDNAGAPVAAGQTPTDTFTQDKLQADWADKTVSRDLPRWSGDSMVGRRYSDCPAAWHDQASGFYEWKARKGREENPVRLKNNGKPWHESDTFSAKLHRTWAQHLRAKAVSARPSQSVPEMGGAGVDIDDMPF